MTAELLFCPEPEAWELRGDRDLWCELNDYFVRQGIPNCLADFLEALFDAAEAFIGQSLHSGGDCNEVSGDFWIFTGLPLLLERYDNLMNMEKSS